MEVGNEMDIAVGKAIGWKYVKGGFGWMRWEVPGSEFYVKAHDWLPSTSDGDAFTALDTVLARDPDLWPYLGKTDDGWMLELSKAGYMRTGAGPTRPEAICRCVLALSEQEGANG